MGEVCMRLGIGEPKGSHQILYRTFLNFLKICKQIQLSFSSQNPVILSCHAINSDKNICLVVRISTTNLVGLLIW